jgi:hypothetical protein
MSMIYWCIGFFLWIMFVRFQIAKIKNPRDLNNSYSYEEIVEKIDIIKVLP